ncbi:hypothetical protein V6Z11_D05G065600 [Gossypium hirsutum]
MELVDEHRLEIWKCRNEQEVDGDVAASHWTKSFLDQRR